MRSIGLLLTLLRLSAAAAAAPGADDVEWATYVPAGALQAEPTDNISATSTGGIAKRRVPSVVDGTKGTHYGDPSEGCMKDEVSLQFAVVC